MTPTSILHRTRRAPVRYFLAGLESTLAAELDSALRSQGCRAADRLRSADIVFCPAAGPALESAIIRSAGRPVIAVSRYPETHQWLDALEAGAADYTVAPFEDIQIRWLLDCHARAQRAASAVA
jgi:CheY-like chemotaxis protein